MVTELALQRAKDKQLKAYEAYLEASREWEDLTSKDVEITLPRLCGDGAEARGLTFGLHPTSLTLLARNTSVMSTDFVEALMQSIKVIGLNRVLVRGGPDIIFERLSYAGDYYGVTVERHKGKHE